ncbi:MAG: DotI/IcmL family type IV secretion protein [Pseudomonadota bacterium]|nr:DotI/IcmL family type IV secretion protein [Pseudomonadota bacterium]
MLNRLKSISITLLLTIFFTAPTMADLTEDKDVINWATTAALAAFSYDALSYQTQFAKLKEKFTDKGWQSFETAIKNSGNLDTVKENKVVVSSYRAAEAKIESFTQEQNTSIWVVKVPTKVTYSNQYLQVEQDIDTYLTIAQSKDKSLKITNINSSLTAPTKTVQATPKPRANCKMATSMSN